MHILTNYCFCGVHWLRIAQSKGYARLCASLPENGNIPSFQESVHLLISRWWTKSHKKRWCQLTEVVLWYLFWISWYLKIGLIDCPQMLVRNYHSTLCNIPEGHRSHKTFGVAGLGLTLHGLVQSNLVGAGRLCTSYTNLRWSDIFNCQI
jgi:hypothetical protein